MGVDLDERCAKMAALNLALRELSGGIYCETDLLDIRDAWMRRDDKPEPFFPHKVNDEPEKPRE